MAEIKSTMEKVLERLAKMDEVSQDVFEEEEKLKEGMRLGADYLNGKITGLSAELERFPANEQLQVIGGVVQTLLRNLVLPRDEELLYAEKAIRGLVDMGKESRELVTLTSEIMQLLEGYLQHKKQIQQQLEVAVQQQIDQALAQKGIPAGSSLKVDPRLHPMFQEEWQRQKESLDDQYGQALQQHKAIIAQYWGG